MATISSVYEHCLELLGRAGQMNTSDRGSCTFVLGYIQRAELGARLEDHFVRVFGCKIILRPDFDGVMLEVQPKPVYPPKQTYV